MTFEDWLVHKGLSVATAYKYSNAVAGPLSTWAMNNDLVQGPLTALSHKSSFDKTAGQIRALPIFLERDSIGKGMYEAALKRFSDYLADGFENDLDSDLDSIFQNDDVPQTEKTNLVKARVGQGMFRQKLIRYWGCCAVTGFTDLNLLVASHIKPWSVCTDAERLDTYNGLLLTPNLDKAFDAGFITFTSQGAIWLSPQLSQPGLLGISANFSIQLTAEHERYMAFHRTQVFRAT
ncbi:HNH endonuclease [Ectopseudomonas mendocina]|uniref:HNH endonuclease n=1 Tax=Ectopseudomonas mendocina TaxID=300 RepID=A0ABZ2RFC5_ECTME